MRSWVVLATLALGGCTGGSDVPKPRRAAVAAWSAALCGGLDTLVTDQKALSQDFSTYATKIVSQPAVSREAFTRALDAVRADFSAGRASVEAVGPPDVGAGPQIQAQVLEALRTGETLYAGVTARIQATEADGKALAAALQAIGADVGTGGHALDDAFDGLDAKDTSGSLTTALRAEPTCASVTR